MTGNTEENKRGGARKGAGRKKTNHPAQQITLRIPHEDYKMLMMYAEFYRKTQTEMIIEALEQYLTMQCLNVDPLQSHSED